MRVIFMGTPGFAVPSLERLIGAGHEVIAVVTQPDKKKGRGYERCAPPIKEVACKNNITVFQFDSLKKDNVYEKLAELEPEIIVVVAYGKILPKNILNLPKYGSVNVHGSLLPKYRGAAPIQWAVMDGCKTTGITTMFMDEGLDTGDILLTEETIISPNETSGELSERLSQIGAKLLLETLDGIYGGKITRVKQDDSRASYAPILTKDLSIINWNKSAVDIHNFVRGLNPWPVAGTTLNGEKLKVYKTKVVDDECGNCGDVKSISPFIVCCADGSAIEILELQLENKKRMSAENFFRGYKKKIDRLL